METLDYIDIRRWSDENRERYLEPVIIYTQSFNGMLRLGESEYACFTVRGHTNGASWNPFFGFILWLDKRHRKVNWGAVGHDFLYQKAGTQIPFYIFDKQNKKRSKKIGSFYVDQKQSDVFIREKCKQLGANLYQRWMIYTGLRIGGRVAFNRYTNFNETTKK